MYEVIKISDGYVIADLSRNSLILVDVGAKWKKLMVTAEEAAAFLKKVKA